MVIQDLEKPPKLETLIKPIDIIEDTEIRGWGYRHQQCLVLFCCLTTAYSMRVCMSVSLVAMTASTHTNGTADIFGNSSQLAYIANGTNYNSNNNSTVIYHGDDVSGLLFAPPYPIFNWDKKVQDTIQSSFFWGYMILQIPAGQLLHHFGARYLLTSSLFINGVISILLPWVAFYGGWVFIMVFRVMQGLSQAFVVPGIHTCLGKWTPLEERARLTSYVLGGQAIGTVLGLPITGFIASSPLGWPGIFRFYGILSVIVGGLIWWLIADTPAEHRSISAAERRYIAEKLGSSKKRSKVPWIQILRCRGLYANIIAHIGTTWGQLTLYSEVPSFMNNVMGVDIKANGLLSALPFLIMWFTNFFFSWLSDMLIVKKYVSVTHTRKLANSLGSIPPAIGLIVLAYAPRDIYIVEIILIVICSFKIATHVGFPVNHIDITPNYSGTLMSISNFVSNLFGSLAPIVAGFILSDASDDVLLWREVFFVAAGIYFITNLVYVVLGDAERAEWDDPEHNEKKETKDEEANEPMLEKLP